MVEAWNSIIEFFFASKDPSFFQTALLAAISALLVRAASPKARLSWFPSHEFNYNMNGPSGQILIRTKQIVFYNNGKSTVEDLEIGLNYPPQHYEVWSPRQFEILELHQGRLMLRFPTLVPKESFVLSLVNLGQQELPWVTTIRAKNAIVQQKNVQPQEIWPRWKINGMWALALLGFAYIIQVLIRLALTWNAIVPATSVTI